MARRAVDEDGAIADKIKTRSVDSITGRATFNRGHATSSVADRCCSPIGLFTFEHYDVR